MKNTVENRRMILVLIVAAIVLHLFFSGRLVSLNQVSDPDIRAQLQELYAEYDKVWAGE